MFAKAYTLVDKSLSCHRIKLSNSLTSILEGAETGVLLSDFAQQLPSGNAVGPDIHFTLLEAAGIYPSLVLNQNAKAKERGSWVPFKIWTSKAAKIVQASWCCF